MVNTTRISQNVDSVLGLDQPQDTGPKIDLSGTTREQRMAAFADGYSQVEQQQEGVVDSGARDEIGRVETRAPTFGEAVQAGQRDLISSYMATNALVRDIVGDDEGAADALDDMNQYDTVTQGMMAGGTSASELIDDPSFGGGLQYAKETLGRLAPMALESVAGALAGSVLMPGPGTVAGASGGAGIRALLRMGVRKSVERTARKAGTQLDDQILSGLMRSRLRQRGALLGALGTEYRAGAAEAYAETDEAGDPSAGRALATAAPYAALGALSDKMVVDTLADVVRASDAPTRQVLRGMLGSLGKNAGAEGATEAGQEELLIRLRDSLTDEDYAGSDEANTRRLEAGVAGAVGGAGRAGVVDAARVAASGLRRGREAKPDMQAFRDRVNASLDEYYARTQGDGNARDMEFDGDAVMPEPQRDIDAQFNAMLDENSPKRAMEVTRGSPMPRGYVPGQNGVAEVQTENGILLTNDADMARSVREGGSVAEALGYRAQKTPGMTRAGIARDAEGNIVHSEMLDDTETDAEAMTRLGQYGQAEMQSPEQVVRERGQRLRQEGRDAELEGAQAMADRTERQLARRLQSRETLRRARQMTDHMDRWKEIDQALPGIEQDIARLQGQHQQQLRQLADRQARRDQAQDLERQRQQMNELLGVLARDATETDPNDGGVEITNDRTGEQRSIPQESIVRARGFLRDQDPSATDDEISTRLRDEFASRGYSLNETDMRPIPVVEVERGQASRRSVREADLSYDDPAAYRNSRNGRTSPTQVLSRQYRLSQNAERTTLNGQAVPKAAVRKLRELRNRFPEDSWSLAKWSDDQGRAVFQVQRETAMTQRAADDPVVRDTEATDSDALEQTRSGTPDGTDRVADDVTLRPGATERVMMATERARWKNGRREAPSGYSMLMTDPQGRTENYNPNMLATAGMDANQYMVGNTRITDAERKQMGLKTALSVLMDRGYSVDMSTVPESYLAKQQTNRRHNRPRWADVAPAWHGMATLEERQAVADEADVDLTQNELMDMEPDELPTSMIEVLENRELDYSEPDMGQRQEERYQQRNFTNRDTTDTRTLAREEDGLMVDPTLPPMLRQMLGEAKKLAGIDRQVVVITDQTKTSMLNSLPKELRDRIKGDPNFASMINGQNPGKLRGRTVMYGEDTAVIWLNSNLRPEQKSLAAAHELGHVAYRQHVQSLYADQRRLQTLQREFEAAQNEGSVRQYNDPQLGFEEWFSDRFAVWVHNRSHRSNVVRAGRFEALYKSLRSIARRLRISARVLARAGNPALQTRIRESQTFSSFMESIARTNTLRNGQVNMRQMVFEQRIRNMADPVSEFAYRQMQAEIDARTADVRVPTELVNAISDDDPVAQTQQERVAERSADGFANEPSYQDYDDMTMGPDPIQPREEFTPEPEAQVDPAGRQEFAPEPEAAQADPAGRQEFTPEPEAAQADPAGRQEFTPEPEAGAGGRGGRGGDNGGTTPPPADDNPGNFKPDPLHDAMHGKAQRWGRTSTYRNVEKWVSKHLGPVGERGLRAIKDLTWTDDSRLRDMGPAGEKLANMFYTPAGQRQRKGVKRGWFNAVESETAHWMEEAESVLPNDRHAADAALAEAQSGRPTSELSPDGKKVREFLKRFHEEYVSKNVKDVGVRDNYFPRVYDMSEIIARSDEFAQLLQEAGYSEQQAASIVRNMMEGESTVELTTSDQEGSGPGMSARLTRQLADLDDSKLQERGFVMEPRAALMGYLRNAVRRGEFETRFSGELPLSQVVADIRRRQRAGQWVDQEFANQMFELERRTKRPDELMITDPSAAIKEQIDKLPQSEQRQARQIVQNYLGRSNSLFGVQLPPSVAKGMSAVSGAMYMATLGLSTISQITDLGAMVLRTRGTEGLGSLYRAIREVPREDRIAMARAVGSISHEANLEALRLSYGNDFMTPGVRRSVDTFFKVIGLEAMTNFSRSVGTQMGAEFIRTNAAKAADGDQRATRYLQELGLDFRQVRAWEQDGFSFESENGNAVRRALFQFTDEGILRPNAAMRPGWASNPWFTLAWQLKSFAWGFYKVVIRGLANEVTQRRNEGASVSEQVAPLGLAAGVMLPLAFTSMVLRDVAKEGLNTVFDDDEYEWNSTKERNAGQWLLELTDRSGMLGPWSLVNSAYDAYSWGQSPAASVAGPAFEMGNRLLQGDVGRVANDMIPVAGLVR